MCGLVGRLAASRSLGVRAALDALSNRGPDGEGIAHHVVGDRMLTLGHRRLSIIDLSDAASQPFASDTADIVMVFNGEIYNHLALRQRGELSSVRFRTHSDTETLLALYRAMGVDGLRLLNGIFAVAILDLRRCELVLARDHLGIKPLYFSCQGQELSFASDTRALSLIAEQPRRFDASCAEQFLLNGFLYEPTSGLVGIRKVAPGSACIFDLADPGLAHHTASIAPAPTADLDVPFDALLEQQVRAEMLADVPVGVFFSGGIDSSAVLAAAPRGTEAFFVDYGEERKDELRSARAIAAALGAPLRVLEANADSQTASSVEREIAEVANGTDEPISDFTFLATRELSHLARQCGYKVMLSGMGADEIFAGYPRYAALRWRSWRLGANAIAAIAPLLVRMPRYAKRVHRLIEYLRAPSFTSGYASLVGYFSNREVATLLQRPFVEAGTELSLQHLLSNTEGLSLLQAARRLDRSGFLAHNLTVTDRASMAEGLEVRVPLLGSDLTHFADRQSDRDLMVRGTQKIPLRRYLASRLDPALFQRAKVGFNPPLDARIAVLGPRRIRDLIAQADPICPLHGPTIDRLIAEHFSGTRNNTYRLWQLCYFACWLQGL